MISTSGSDLCDRQQIRRAGCAPCIVPLDWTSRKGQIAAAGRRTAAGINIASTLAFTPHCQATPDAAIWLTHENTGGVVIITEDGYGHFIVMAGLGNRDCLPGGNDLYRTLFSERKIITSKIISRFQRNHNAAVNWDPGLNFWPGHPFWHL